MGENAKEKFIDMAMQSTKGKAHSSYSFLDGRIKK